jgi:hypothetical protein
MKARITCEIFGNLDESLYLSANTMNELIDKIKEWTTASDFEINHYKAKGKEEYLNSGWFYKGEK